jgi:hypothetical protein
VKSASPDQRRPPRDGVALPASKRRRFAKAPERFWVEGRRGARSGGRRGRGRRKQEKSGLGVSLVDAVGEPGGHYCRSSDAAVLLCVRIIALAAACVAWQQWQRHGRGQREKGGGRRRLSRVFTFCTACRKEMDPFVAVFSSSRGISGALFAGLQETDKITQGSAYRAHRHLKAGSLCCGILRVVSSEIMGGSRAVFKYVCCLINKNQQRQRCGC